MSSSSRVCGSYAITPISATKQFLPSVQFGRGLAALLVLLYHSTAAALGPDHRMVFWGGAAGVDIFFVVSGFIIAYIAPGERAGTFLIKRAIRIAPPYYFYTTLVVAILLLAPSLYANLRFRLDFVVSSYLFLLSRSNAGDLGVALGVGWTLAYEAYFYVLTAVAIWLLRDRAWMLVTAVIVSGAAVAPFINPPAPLTPVLTALPLEFLGGMLLARLYSAGRRLPSALAVLAILAGLAVIAYAGAINAVGGIFYNPVRIWWYGIPGVLIVAGLLSLNSWRFPRWSLWLGNISYSLYLSHTFALEGLERVLKPLGLPPTGLIGIFVIAAIMIAALSYRLIEAPSTKYLARQFRVRDPRPSAPPS